MRRFNATNKVNNVPAAEVKILIPIPRVLSHNDEISAKHEASAQQIAQVSRLYAEEWNTVSEPKVSSTRGKRRGVRGGKKVSRAGDQDQRIEEEEENDDKEEEEEKEEEATTALHGTPHIDRVLEMMRARLKDTQQQSAAPISINVRTSVVIETADEEVVRAADLYESFSLGTDDTACTPNASFSSHASSSSSSDHNSHIDRCRGTQERKFSDASDTNDSDPRSEVPHASEPVLPSVVHTMTNISRTLVGIGPDVIVEEKVEAERSSRTMSMLARQIMRRQDFPQFDLSARQEDVQRRLNEQQARKQALQHALVERLRAAVITQIILHHKEKGINRADMLLAPLPGRSCRFMSRKRQRRSIQRVGKGQIAALFERHHILRQGFAAILRDAYSPDSESDDAEGEGLTDSTMGVLLPNGHEWVYGTDDESGAPYYFNTITGVSQWEPPLLVTGQWIRQTDAERNHDYWVNMSTGASTWELPPEENWTN